MKEFKHVMIDIETLGNQSNSVITEIATVFFDLESGEIGPEMHMHIDPQSCVDAGLHMDVSTIMWWMKQDAEARAGFEYPHKIRLESAMQRLNAFLSLNCPVEEIRPWGNSARFDLGIISDAANAVGAKRNLWMFYNELDVRTLTFFNPSIKENMKFEGTPHNAIDDCKHQIKYCSAIFNSLNKV